MKKITILFTIFFLSLNAKEQTIVLGAGCFWGVQKSFDNLKGVKNTVVGFAGGEWENPTYDRVLAHRLIKNIKNHAEVVKITYDDNIISTRKLLEHFWEIHNPTQKNRQGNDWGSNYRSIILYTNKEQKNIALQTKKEYQKLLNKNGYKTITTEIAPLKKFYRAKEYHQKYLEKHPNGYCPNHSTGVKFKKLITPLKGKEILVIKSNNCPFCQKFKKDVINNYKGDITIREAYKNEIKEYKLKSKIIGTPAIFFIKDGKEIFSHIGYLSSREFYKKLGAFKLGKNSQAYKVAYDKKTDKRFCKKYEKFKNIKDGVFIDKISKEVLFDTKDRFNSHSGWLSFYKPINKNVIEYREDNSFGMHRIEVIAKKSGAHLGHVFPRYDGKKRFCINASVLEFIPRDKNKSDTLFLKKSP